MEIRSHPLQSMRNATSTWCMRSLYTKISVFVHLNVNEKPTFWKISPLGPRVLKTYPFWCPQTPFTRRRKAITTKKNVRFKKYPNTCGRGLINKQQKQEPISRSEQLPCALVMALSRTSLFSERFWREFWISLNSTNQSAKPNDLKIIYFAF